MIIVADGVVVEPPPVPGPVVFPAIPRVGVDVYLTGVDGSVWDLVNGPVRLQAGAKLAYAEPEHLTRSSPALDGADWYGFRTPPGEMFLPVRVEDATSLGWRDVDAAFAAAVDPSGEVTVTVVTPDALARSATGRYTSGLDATFERDPLMMRHAVYGLTLATNDPFWRSPRLSAQFSLAAPAPFFPGPPWTLNPGRITNTATVSNPGSVPAWPRWTVTGPFTSFTVGVGAAVVTLVATVPAGSSRIVDMDPRRRSIVTGAGADAWAEVTAAAFTPIPTGQDVPLLVDVVGGTAGTTTVTLELTPAHRKPW